MEKALAYLRETLSNYLNEHEVSQKIYEKIEQNHYKNEDSFVDDLAEDEMAYLNDILPDELEYVQKEKDDKRYNELNAIYTRLI